LSPDGGRRPHVSVVALGHDMIDVKSMFKLPAVRAAVVEGAVAGDDGASVVEVRQTGVDGRIGRIRAAVDFEKDRF
jgi:hypothetical protein